MLRSRVSQEYARWWQFWLSKLPHNEMSQPSKVTAAMLNGHSFLVTADRLRVRRSPARTMIPLQCPAGTEGLYIDEES
jgi:hypothetical protein